MQISRPARLLLFYGMFAVLSELCFILLYVEIQSHLLPPALLRHFYLPWLEYPLCALSLIFGGAYFLDYIQKNEASD
ncbi:MAG: hypothetical protein J6Q82_01815 [Clostridia bacterium]|nr:hypothetical protein [Clostridia bacterium]